MAKHVAQDGRKRRWEGAWFAAGLVVLTILAYGPALTAGFIWDDDDYVRENPTLRSVEGLGRIWTELGAVPQYYPLTHTTFWVEYRLWGVNPKGYHATNVLLHAGSAILLWRILRRLKVPGAIVAAGLFAVHPVNVESVAWITERKNTLSLLFYLFAGYSYIRFLRWDGGEGAGEGEWVMRGVTERDGKWYGIAFLCFVAALCSKTVTSTFPG